MYLFLDLCLWICIVSLLAAVCANQGALQSFWPLSDTIDDGFESKLFGNEREFAKNQKRLGSRQLRNTGQSPFHPFQTGNTFSLSIVTASSLILCPNFRLALDRAGEGEAPMAPLLALVLAMQEAI